MHGQSLSLIQSFFQKVGAASRGDERILVSWLGVEDGLVNYHLGVEPCLCRDEARKLSEMNVCPVHPEVNKPSSK